jgi:D-galactonate transporter
MQNPALDEAQFEKATYTRVALRLIPVLFVCYILNYIDRVNVGYAKLQMQSDLGLSDLVYGTGAGIFFLGYFLFEVPSNLILQRVGARLWIARIMITWGLISSATMFVATPTQFYVVRFLLGVAEAGFFPGIILYLTYWFPSAWRTRMFAWFITAMSLSFVVGGPLSGWIMKHMAGVHGWAGWQWLFLIEGVPSVLMGIAVLWLLDDGPRTAKWLGEGERQLLLARLEEERQAKVAAGEGSHSLKEAFGHWKVWVLSAMYFTIGIAFYGVAFWLPQIIKDLGYTDVLDIGLISAIPWFIAAIVMVANGTHSDRTGERRWHIAVPAFVGAAGFVLAGLNPGAALPAMIGITAAAIGIMCAVSTFWSLPTAILSGTAAAAGIAWINSVGNLAGYVSPTVVGWIRQALHEPTYAMYLQGFSLACTGLLAIFLTRRAK